MKRDEPDRMERWAAELREADAVPPPPREEMWASIDFARRVRAAQPARRVRPGALTGLGLAASLLLGISIGRATMGGQDPAGPPPADDGVLTAADPGDVSAHEPPALFRLVAEEHMAEAEVFLTGLDRATPESPSAVADWARSLLMDTRLLLETPVAADPDRARLLLDLELVLAQIAGLPSDPDTELEIIRNGIRQTNVLARLRSASDALAAAGM